MELCNLTAFLTEAAREAPSLCSRLYELLRQTFLSCSLVCSAPQRTSQSETQMWITGCWKLLKPETWTPSRSVPAALLFLLSKSVSPWSFVPAAPAGREALSSVLVFSPEHQVSAGGASGIFS